MATNLWWNWHLADRMLFKELDRQVWKESGHNTIKMVRALPQRVLESAPNDRRYLRHYYRAFTVRGGNENGRRLVPENIIDLGSLPIAYFSPENTASPFAPFLCRRTEFFSREPPKRLQ